MQITHRIFFIVAISICIPTTNSCKTHHNKKVVAKLKKELHMKNIVPKRKAILSGLLWCIRFSDKNSNFDFILSEYLTMLYELTLNKKDAFIKSIATKLIKNAIKRATKRLPKIFSYDRESKWDFISTLPMVHLFANNKNKTLKRFARFYKKKLPKSNKPYYLHSPAYALKTKNYDLLGDYLIDYAFLDLAYRTHADKKFQLPKNNYAHIEKICRKLDFIYTHKSDHYHDQNYYITHVVYAMTRYGTQSIPKNNFTKKIHAYLQENLSFVLNDVKDIDLIGEFIHCLKIYKQHENKKLKEAIRYLISQQHTDGSWKNPPDKDADPYDIFHPTWTSITALHSV